MNIRRSIIRFGILLGWLFASTASAQVFLFPPNPPDKPTTNLFPVPHYTELVESLVLGQIIAFEDGSRFEYLGKIGMGGTSRILKVKALNGNHAETVMALRIPIQSDLLSGAQNWEIDWDDFMQIGALPPQFSHTFSFYIDDAIENADLFAEAGFGPKMYQAFAGQYVASEMIDRQFSLDEYIDGKVRLPQAEQEKVDRALTLFIHRTAGILEIQDISQPGQVLYDGQRFVLVDRYGVEFVTSNLYPWAFLGPLIGGLVEEVVSQREHLADPNQTKLERERIRQLAEREWKEARLNMLETGVNPLTGESLIDRHHFFIRNFSFWRRVYVQLRKTRKIRACNALLRGDIFPATFTKNELNVNPLSK